MPLDWPNLGRWNGQLEDGVPILELDAHPSVGSLDLESNRPAGMAHRVRHEIFSESNGPTVAIGPSTPMLDGEANGGGAWFRLRAVLILSFPRAVDESA